MGTVPLKSPLRRVYTFRFVGLRGGGGFGRAVQPVARSWILDLDLQWAESWILPLQRAGSWILDVSDSGSGALAAYDRARGAPSNRVLHVFNCIATPATQPARQGIRV